MVPRWHIHRNLISVFLRQGRHRLAGAGWTDGYTHTYLWIPFQQTELPVTERVASGVSKGEMYRSLFNPLFICMIILMFGTAITELFTGQWIDVLLKNVSDNAILLLTIETGIMVIGRGFAGPVVHKFSPTGVLLISAILSAVGLYLLGHSRQYAVRWRHHIWDGRMLFLANHVRDSYQRTCQKQAQ
jgi:hypothetical protein